MKAHSTLIETGMTGPLLTDAKLNLGEEVIAIVKLRCSEQPHKKTKGRDGGKTTWRQGTTIQLGMIVVDEARSNNLVEELAELAAEDPSLLDGVGDEEGDI